MPAPATVERELLEKFRGCNAGFQAGSHSTYRQHEEWRHDVLLGLKLLEAEGLVVVLQLVPCRRHRKCASRPLAAGCSLTPAGQKIRGL